MSIVLQASPLEPTIKRSGKKTGVHRQNKLNAAEWKTLPPGFHSDGSNLYLSVDKVNPNSPNEPPARRWVLRIVVGGQTRDIGVGSGRKLTLAEARKKAAKLRDAISCGRNPIADRREQRAIVIENTMPLFKDVASDYYETLMVPTFTSVTYSRQWWRDLSKHVLEYKASTKGVPLGEMHVDAMRPSDVLPAITAIWNLIPDTATKVLDRAKNIFDYAISKYDLKSANPAAGIAMVLPAQNRQVVHHPALQQKDVSDFVKSLRSTKRVNIKIARMTEFCLLTAMRTTEVRGARWSEIRTDDTGRKYWRVPGGSTGRLKVKAMPYHDVPLSPRCLEILQEMETYRALDSDLIFPSDLGTDKMYSQVAMRNALLQLDRMYYEVHGEAVVPHGFRSTFRDFCAEQHADFGDSNVVEMCLCHTVKSKVAAAYLRTKFYELRIPVMIEWSRFCCGEEK